MSNAQIGRDVRAALTHFMVRVLDPVTRMLWVTLVAEQDDLVCDGVLRGGSKLSFCWEFSRWFLFDENQVLNSVETLLKTGLLTELGDGSLVMAPLAGCRQSAGKPRNLGGRPRKGESASEAYARKQREEEQLRQQRSMRLMSVIPGGLEEGAEKPAETPVDGFSETPPRERVAAASSLSEERKQQQQLREDTGLSSLAAEVAQASGMPLASVDAGDLRGWIEQGATIGLVLDVVRAVCSRKSYQRPRSVRYFTPMILEALGGKTAGKPAVAEGTEPCSDADLEAYMGLMKGCQDNWLHGYPTHPKDLLEADRQEQRERWEEVRARRGARSMAA